MTEIKNPVSVSLDGLTIGYGTSRDPVVIQRDLTCELLASEFTCLLGPNGAGKTTLLRTMSGFLPPVSGSVFIDGEDVADMPRDVLSKKVSVVLTEKPAVTSMTVEQLVAVGRSPYTGFWGRLTDRDRLLVEDAMKATHTLNLKGRYVDTLSDGELQKVMIAKALAQETPVILLDEPTAFLDYPSKADMMRLLRDLSHKQHKTVFLSTHDLNMALAIADSLWLVDRERGVSAGSPRELADAGTLQSYFLRPGLTFDSENLIFKVS